MSPDDVTKLIARYNEAWNRQEIDTIASLHPPEIVFHNHTADERAEGADAVRAHIGRIFENNPDMRFSTRSFHAACRSAGRDVLFRSRSVEESGSRTPDRHCGVSQDRSFVASRLDAL